MSKEIIGGEIRVGGVTMPLAKAVRAGDFVFVSGQVAISSEGEIVAGGIAEQTRGAMDSMAAVLKEAGCDLGDVVETTVWLDDPRDFWNFNKVYAEYFTNDPPARSTLRADLMLDAKVEIEAVAYKPQQS